MKRRLSSVTWATTAAIVLMVISPGYAQSGSGSATIEITVNDSEAGTVVIEPDQETYPIGTWVTLSAWPVDGYEFDRWVGDVTAYETPLTIVVTGDTAIHAVFEMDESPLYSLTLIADPSGAGTIIRDPVAAEYEPGTEVTVRAVAAEGFVFEGWQTDDSGTNGELDTSDEITVVMNDDLDVTAKFAAAAVVEPDENSSSVSSGRSSGSLCGSMGLISLGLTAMLLVGWRLRR
jgi:uncharacterized repeat protein (TIGR02543 family)